MRTPKDLSYLPTLKEVLEKTPKARVKSYAGNHDHITLSWDLNRAAIADQMFEIRIGKERAVVNAEELRHYMRAV